MADHATKTGRGRFMKHDRASGKAEPGEKMPPSKKPADVKTKGKKK